jgi:hypothetical protein
MPITDRLHEFVLHLPIATTVMSAVFLFVLLRRAATRGFPPHLMWWAAGVFAYGLGTSLESSITLFGNSLALNKAWYIAGALLGGYPLAQGTVYLLTSRKFANIATAITVPFMLALAIAVVLSPVNADALREAIDSGKPSGAILVWTWIRWCTPFLNLYAVAFLIGGAAWSAVRYLVAGTNPRRAAGNIFIAMGAIMPAIGGSMTKAGIVEALYIGELIGIVLIWIGYSLCVSKAHETLPADAPLADNPLADAAS